MGKRGTELAAGEVDDGGHREHVGGDVQRGREERAAIEPQGDEGRGVRRELDEQRDEERALEGDDAEAVGEDGEREEPEERQVPGLDARVEA